MRMARASGQRPVRMVSVIMLCPVSVSRSRLAVSLQSRLSGIVLTLYGVRCARVLVRRACGSASLTSRVVGIHTTRTERSDKVRLAWRPGSPVSHRPQRPQRPPHVTRSTPLAGQRTAAARPHVKKQRITHARAWPHASPSAVWSDTVDSRHGEDAAASETNSERLGEARHGERARTAAAQPRW